jgi:hypothetical protein
VRSAGISTRFDRAPGRSRIARVLSWAGAIAEDFSRGLWAHAKVHFAFPGLPVIVAVLLVVVAEIAAHPANLAAWALVGAGSAGLLAWVRFIAVPLVTKGKLPDGRNVADVLTRRRIRRQLAHERRQALRRWRDSPRRSRRSAVDGRTDPRPATRMFRARSWPGRRRRPARRTGRS